MREVPRRCEGQDGELFCCRFHDLCTVGVTEVGAEEPRNAIDEAAAAVVDDIAALTSHDDLGSGIGVLAHVGEVEK